MVFGITEYTKNCAICGEEFKTKAPTAKYCVNHRHTSRNPNHKTKVRCEACGRHINSGIPFDSEERALCSFCEKNERDAIKRIREEKMRYKRLAKPCTICGKLAIWVKHTKVCPECYYKDAFPSATEVKEVGT